MKRLCLVLVATAKAALLDAQEATISYPWISEGGEGFFSFNRYEETASDSLEQELSSSSEATSLSTTANVLLGIALVYNFLSRKVLGLPANRQKIQAFDQTIVTHSKNPLKHLSYYAKMIYNIFGIWIIPLLASFTFLYDWKAAMNFLNTRNYTEALFISVIMTIASSHPITTFVESFIRKVAALGKESPGAWWVSLLTVGPILGSIITEAGAMIVTSLLLAKQFYTRPVSQKLAYATLGLLFTHISLGAIMANFCTPVDWLHTEQLSEDEILSLAMFSWKSLLAIFTSTICYYFYFRNEFAELAKQNYTSYMIENKNPVPWWVTATHAICLIGAILSLYHPSIFIGITCLFLIFHEITHQYQTRLKLRPPLLVGFFFSGLVIHGGLQEWWIAPLLERVDALMLTGASYLFGSCVDGATLTYLATLLPSLNDATKYSVIVGTLAAGGLTVIGHPFKTSQDTPLNTHFVEGISPKKLFLAALFPMFVTASIFFIFRV